MKLFCHLTLIPLDINLENDSLRCDDVQNIQQLDRVNGRLGGYWLLVLSKYVALTDQCDVELLLLDLLQSLHECPPWISGGRSVGVESLVAVTDGVVYQPGVGLSVDQSQGPPHQLQVPGVGVHRHHVPPHGRHYQGVHPNVTPDVLVVS